MKALTNLILLAAAFAAAPLHAAIIVPGANGTDGVLEITENTEIDLSQAVTAVWDSDNTAHAGKGVYDPQKWAVVFKYTSVNVAAGATVTFRNHPSRAPVVWLVSGNVTIAGTVSLNGHNHAPAPLLSEPGPGGFRGGARYFDGLVTGGSGFGPSGGQRVGHTGATNGPSPGSGSYGSIGTLGGESYGNPSIIPLIGGAGGGSLRNTATNGVFGGGAGGGALLLASSQAVTINGIIQANGGNGGNVHNATNSSSGSGSGGAIRLIANQLLGSGSLVSIGGIAVNLAGGNGRIRLERPADTSTIAIQPAPSVVDLEENATAILWPPAGAPEVRVLSIGDKAAPADPRAAFGTLGADVSLPNVPATTVTVETKYVEAESQVLVRITPRDSADFTEISATRIDPPVSASPLTYHWEASVPTNLGYSAIQVRVVRP